MGKARMLGRFAAPKKKGRWERKVERKFQEGKSHGKNRAD